ncbi:phytanoyl-CoA dioxygenase family protein [Kutzneria sp. CA-103260]|uniref:phytanoyl-CoA dioxygenase family protein n=1 Tax=Kutzneria sp. CA-103260 TaxID=2802641 RepID=UPI001BA64285|nr:phytanoyl-CoA dioxygenase family protein [Kutzneria sp. CA-103260]QUQ68810.1 Phytanoyl-CoA dioxygenase (PhyH) [Kutzneria sp. CA-103260]
MTIETERRRLTVGDQVRSLEIDGYAVLPGVLDEDAVHALGDLQRRTSLDRSSYTDKQWYRHNLQRDGDPEVLRLVEQPRILAFLDTLFADELVCIGVSCSRSEPGYDGMPLHTDSHPYGSNNLGAVGTSPVIVRVLYYLDDITPDRAPLLVVPGSHLSLHRDAMPYLRYRSHPDAVAVTCRAGDAVLINQRVFHAAGANRTDQPRRMFAASYRPAWAGPTLPVPTDGVPERNGMKESVYRMLADPNRRTVDTHIVNWSDDLPESGVGLGRSRWADSRPS